MRMEQGLCLMRWDKNAGRRFKMVTKVDIPGHGAHMYNGFSEDGIHWGELILMEYNPQADCHNFPFWNEEEQC